MYNIINEAQVIKVEAELGSKLGENEVYLEKLAKRGLEITKRYKHVRYQEWFNNFINNDLQ
jgi:hypothetical protein